MTTILLRPYIVLGVYREKDERVNGTCAVEERLLKNGVSAYCLAATLLSTIPKTDLHVLTESQKCRHLLRKKEDLDKAFYHASVTFFLVVIPPPQ